MVTAFAIKPPDKFKRLVKGVAPWLHKARLRYIYRSCDRLNRYIRRIKSKFEDKRMSISDERGWDSDRNATILLRKISTLV